MRNFITPNGDTKIVATFTDFFNPENDANPDHPDFGEKFDPKLDPKCYKLEHSIKEHNNRLCFFLTSGPKCVNIFIVTTVTT